jgi:hypothetical protein
MLSDHPEMKDVEQIENVKKVSSFRYLGMQISLSKNQLFQNAKQSAAKYLA